MVVLTSSSWASKDQLCPGDSSSCFLYRSTLPFCPWNKQLTSHKHFLEDSKDEQMIACDGHPHALLWTIKLVHWGHHKSCLTNMNTPIMQLFHFNIVFNSEIRTIKMCSVCYMWVELVVNWSRLALLQYVRFSFICKTNKNFQIPVP